MIGNLRYHLVVLWAMAVALVTVSPVFAGSSKWSGGPESQARLFVATDGQGVRYLALHINLAKGWKTYWRNAGDAGAPPELDWSGSKNIELTTAQWPAPKRFHAFGYDSFGFEGQLVLPYRFKVKDPEKPSTVVMQINYLVCAHICLPKSAKLQLSAGPSAKGKKKDGKLLQTALAQVPKANGKAPIHISNVVVAKKDGGEVIQVTAHSKTILGMPDLLIETTPGFTFSRPEHQFSRDRKSVTMTVVARYRADNAPTLVGKKLRITIVDDAESVDHQTIAALGS